MPIKFQGSSSYQINKHANTTKRNILTNNSENKNSTIAVTGALVTTGTATAIISGRKAGKKIIETINKQLPELETKVKGLWGKLTGKAKKEAEARKAEEAAEAARKRAEETRKRLEAEAKAQKEALKQKQKACEELIKQKELKKAEELFNSCKSDILDSTAEIFAPKNTTPNLYEYRKRLLRTQPQNIFDSIAKILEKHHKKGAPDTTESTVKILKEVKSQLTSQLNQFIEENAKEIERLKKIGQADYAQHTNKKFLKQIAPIKDYESYIDELIVELNKTGNIEESGSSTLRKAINTVEKNRETAKIAAAKARQATVDAISRDYQQQLAPIKERIRYKENYVPNPSTELTNSQRQVAIEELRGIIGESSSLTPDSSIAAMNIAWKNKYLTMPFSMNCKEGETAILNMFPRYESGVIKYREFSHNVHTGDFKYEPVYRQMHIENPEEFVKQFENIGGVYTPGRLQSCAKTRYYGEAWGSIENIQYGFVEWNPQNNVKFVIHPKGPISNAADIGEGKYGNYEVLYSADSKFRILGTVKKTVTQEEIQKGMGSFNNPFDDFEKYEIHLQEL